MKHNVYAIFDSVSGTYAQPHCAINDATAIRNVTDLLRRDETLARHANDYSLYQVGTYDDRSGDLRHIVEDATVDTECNPRLVVRLGSLLDTKE